MLLDQWQTSGRLSTRGGVGRSWQKHHTRLECSAMKKTKKYSLARFSPEVLQEAAQTLWPAKVTRRRRDGDQDSPVTRTLTVESDGVRWDYDDEKEFFAGYRGSSGEAHYRRTSSKSSIDVSVYSPYFTEIAISAPDRATIESAFSVFEVHLDESLVPGPPERGELQKTKEYKLARFSPEVLQEAVRKLWPDAGPAFPPFDSLMVESDEQTWRYDDEQEFFADYRGSSGTAYYRRRSFKTSLDVAVHSGGTKVEIRASKRATIESVFSVFETKLGESLVPSPPAPKPSVFIGHGQAPDWRDLKDHLHDQHGYPVEAYETGSRAGCSIRDVLEEMLSSSSFAVLVMTGEDQTASGDVRSRQNVVHEAGLFQGKLGFNRAIVLLENGVETFSNIHGIQRIRFNPGAIRSTFGDVLATLKREFGDHA